MLEIIKDKDNNIQAVLEWYLVNGEGNYDPSGKFIWINELETSATVNGDGFGIIKQFVKTIIHKCPQAEWGYFKREKKYPARKFRIYHKNRWLKLIRED